MNTYCLFNGEIHKTAEPVLKVNDLGLLRGYGVFDFFPIVQSKPLFFNDYWNRFSSSAKQMRLPFEWEEGPLTELLDHLIRKNELTDGFCKLLLTGGYSSNGFHPDNGPNLIVTTQGPIHYPAVNYEKGIKLLSRSEEHTSELQSRENLVCRLLLEKKKAKALATPRPCA